jgi:hypothetical protein
LLERRRARGVRPAGACGATAATGMGHAARQAEPLSKCPRSEARSRHAVGGNLVQGVTAAPDRGRGDGEQGVRDVGPVLVHARAGHALLGRGQGAGRTWVRSSSRAGRGPAVGDEHARATVTGMLVPNHSGPASRSSVERVAGARWCCCTLELVLLHARVALRRRGLASLFILAAPVAVYPSEPCKTGQQRASCIVNHLGAILCGMQRRHQHCSTRHDTASKAAAAHLSPQAARHVQQDGTKQQV